MNRILEFSPSQEEAVVSRILVLVHQAVDEYLPSAEKAGRQFTKTVFSGEGERTGGVQAAPLDGEAPRASAFALGEETSPDGRPLPPSHSVPPPPAASSHSAPATQPPTTDPVAEATAAALSAAPGSRPTQLDQTMAGLRAASGNGDWTTRVILGLLLAGLVLLGYALFA